MKITPPAIEVYARGMKDLLKELGEDLDPANQVNLDFQDCYETLLEATKFGLDMITSANNSITEHMERQIPVKKKKTKKPFANNEEE